MVATADFGPTGHPGLSRWLKPTTARDSHRDREPPPRFVPFGLGEEVSPPWLLDLAFQRQLRVPLIDEPMGDGKYPTISQKLHRRSGRSDPVDHPNPANGGEAEGADLGDEVTTPKLELTLERHLVFGVHHLHRFGIAACGEPSCPGHRRQGPSAGLAVGDQYRTRVLGFRSPPRGKPFLTQIDSKGLPAVRTDWTPRPSAVALAGHSPSLAPGARRLRVTVGRSQAWSLRGDRRPTRGCQPRLPF